MLVVLNKHKHHKFNIKNTCLQMTGTKTQNYTKHISSVHVQQFHCRTTKGDLAFFLSCMCMNV